MTDKELCDQHGRNGYREEVWRDTDDERVGGLW